MAIPDPTRSRDGLSAEQADLVRQHLGEVLASNTFAGSRRAQDFLQLIVEHALAGRLDSLRERMIGAEMFGRPVDYDTANDAVVRVKATEVRKKLAFFYLESQKKYPVRIGLPAGSYVPVFHWDSEESSAQWSDEASSMASADQLSTEAQPAELPEALPNVKTGRIPLSRRIYVYAVVAAMLIALLGYLAFKRRRMDANIPLESRSIAILPLRNLSGDPSQDYFADGMTEELTADLGQISALHVISRTSAMTYANTKKTLPKIAAELGVDTIVEGSILREGTHVRVTAQLIDARTDQHLWARNYVRNLTSVLELQAEVAHEIANEIRVEVTPQEQVRLGRQRSVNSEAQDLYLQGLHFLYSNDPKRAIGYLQQSVDSDPNFASAHAALAAGYNVMGESGWLPYDESFTRQKLEASKAIELDEALPEGHAQLAGAVMNLDWDWTTPDKEFRRALELNPNSATVHANYAFYLMRLGRVSEALAEMQRVTKLDPVSSSSASDAGYAYYFARQYDKALVEFQNAQAQQPGATWLHFPLGTIYTEQGKYAEAVTEFQKIGDQQHPLGHMGNALARMGRAVDARATISRLQQQLEKSGVGRYEIALVYAGLHENDQAFEWLEKSFDAHDKGLTYLKIDPCLDPLRADPRFASLVRRVGLPA